MMGEEEKGGEEETRVFAEEAEMMDELRSGGRGSQSHAVGRSGWRGEDLSYKEKRRLEATKKEERRKEGEWGGRSGLPPELEAYPFTWAVYSMS